MASFILKSVLLIFVFFITNFSIVAQIEGAEEGIDVIKTVVIDAGHGGKDPGCIGEELLEKDVALNISLKLGQYIKEAFPNVNVIYTRDKDVFLELDQRAKIANDNEADLFISIHANAAASSAYGTETFVLGLHRTESQQKVAERENSIIHFEENSEEKYADFDMSPDAIIARQIQLSVFLNQSISFADVIQQQFSAIGRKDRGVKQAGFIVLYKTTMPSVLVEAGFLTNKEEEEYLKVPFHQSKMAHAIFNAFQLYKFDLEDKKNNFIKAPSFVEEEKQYLVELSKFNEIKEEENIKKEETSFSDIVKENNNEVEENDILFKVQIVTSRTQLPIYDDRFRGMKVDEYFEMDLYKYTSGVFVNDIEQAQEHKRLLQEKGFEHAFIVAFKNGERISVSDAINLLNQ